MQPTEGHGTSGGDLRDYLRVAARRKRTIIFAISVVTLVVLSSIIVQVPKYESTAAILLKPLSTSTILNPSANFSTNPALDVQTQIQVILSQPVKQAVRANLGAAPAVSVAALGQTEVIKITAQSTDPPTAATVANAYANEYIGYRRAQDLNDALAAESQIQSRIAELQLQVDSLNAQVKSADLKNQTSIAATIAPQIDSLLQQQSTYKQQLGQIQVAAAIQPGGAQLVNPATVPTSPVSPRPVRDLILALAAGLILGVGAALALEYLDDSINSREDLDHLIQRVPTVAVIPRIQQWKAKGQPVIVSISDPRSPTAEAYRSLRTAVQFASLDRPLQTLQVTSPAAGEGKTTTLANLAVALAQVGQLVIVVCCDLRQPRLHHFFGVDNAVGFTSVVLGQMSSQAALQNVESVPGLRILASGPLPHNPSELLSSKRAAEVLLSLCAQADIVLIDSPPVLPVTDSSVIAGLVDATLLVVMANSTTRRQATQAAEVLAQVEAPVIGTVLNGATGGSYGSAYYYRYESAPPRRWGLGNLSGRPSKARAEPRTGIDASARRTAVLAPTRVILTGLLSDSSRRIRRSYSLWQRS